MMMRGICGPLPLALVVVVLGGEGGGGVVVSSDIFGAGHR